MTETRQPGRGTAAADPAGGEPRPGPPEERLQSAFLRIARADQARTEMIEDPKDEVQLLSAGTEEEIKAFALEQRRLQAFDRFAVPGGPGECQEFRVRAGRLIIRPLPL